MKKIGATTTMMKPRMDRRNKDGESANDRGKREQGNDGNGKWVWEESPCDSELSHARVTLVLMKAIFSFK